MCKLLVQLHITEVGPSTCRGPGGKGEEIPYQKNACMNPGMDGEDGHSDFEDDGHGHEIDENDRELLRMGEVT